MVINFSYFAFNKCAVCMMNHKDILVNEEGVFNLLLSHSMLYNKLGLIISCIINRFFFINLAMDFFAICL